MTGNPGDTTPARRARGKGGRKSRAIRNRELEEEVALLRARMDLVDEPMTVAAWHRIQPRKTRDELAALAYLRCWGHERNALRLLGFNFTGQDALQGPAVFAAAAEIFESPAVVTIVERMLNAATERQADRVARLMNTAHYGPAAAAVRAVETIGPLLAGLSAHGRPQPAQDLLTSLGWASATPDIVPVIEDRPDDELGALDDKETADDANQGDPAPEVPKASEPGSSHDLDAVAALFRAPTRAHEGDHPP